MSIFRMINRVYFKVCFVQVISHPSKIILKSILKKPFFEEIKGLKNKVIPKVIVD